MSLNKDSLRAQRLVYGFKFLKVLIHSNKVMKSNNWDEIINQQPSENKIVIS